MEVQAKQLHRYCHRACWLIVAVQLAALVLRWSSLPALATVGFVLIVVLLILLAIIWPLHTAGQSR